jgi:hypothetical protein
MCICDDEDDEDIGPRVVIDDTTLARARILDARMDGDSVPEAAWAIFAGRMGGSIAWPHFQRMQASYEAAATVEKGLAHMRRERRTTRRIKCEPMALQALASIGSSAAPTAGA